MTIKKCFILLVAVVSLVTVMGCASTSGAEGNAPAEAKTTVIIHYNRPAADYDGWNVWAWATNGINGGFNFTEEDSFGKIAFVTGEKLNTDIGFVLRSTDNWETAVKDIEDDRKAIVTDKFGEIWLYEGDAEVYTVAPEGATPYDRTKLAPVPAEVPAAE